ncbi:MAG: DUF3795 domain-containing protein, partial [Spirochaetaceae bacterium]|nr:DUF3795 domain-containing protein [Spirochaetaceae bacterium]
ARWTKDFSFAFTPEMINCTGCRETGAKIGHCSECGMRMCGLEKGVANCGVCADYATCSKIGEFLKMVPDAKKRLDAVRVARA